MHVPPVLRLSVGLACVLRAGAEGGAVHVTPQGETKPAEPEAVNPYTADGDSTSECYAWAADGQCRLNPGHMLASCKYSCWEWFEFRQKSYPDAPIDKNFNCHAWAQAGECHKNTAYMKEQCPEACKDRYEPPEPAPEPTKPKKKKKKKRKKTAEADSTD